MIVRSPSEPVTSEKEEGQVQIALSEHLVNGLAEMSARHLTIGHAATMKIRAGIVISLQEIA